MSRRFADLTLLCSIFVSRDTSDANRSGLQAACAQLSAFGVDAAEGDKKSSRELAGRSAACGLCDTIAIRFAARHKRQSNPLELISSL